MRRLCCKGTAKRTFRRYSDIAPPPHCLGNNHT
jgi:hypothetical protein